MFFGFFEEKIMILVFLTAASCPKKDFYTPTPPPKNVQQTFVLRTQNVRQKAGPKKLAKKGLVQANSMFLPLWKILPSLEKSLRTPMHSRKFSVFLSRFSFHEVKNSKTCPYFD